MSILFFGYFEVENSEEKKMNLRIYMADTSWCCSEYVDSLINLVLMCVFTEHKGDFVKALFPNQQRY